MENIKGVYVDKLKNGQFNYRASVTVNKKHISLGSYPSLESAANAYSYALNLYKDTTVFLSSYSEDCPLKFEKFITIINLRDNNIYFSNPIYLRKSYFSYFLSPADELKFDMDDLFYFSSHKIMKRGNHFFVSDFGMQESVLSRFNIRPFSVVGRDFVFANEDRLDFRRENLEIINPYFGVLKKENGSDIYYEVLIHVNGNLKVGTYEDITVAAIAYNKAVDTLKKNGINKNFMQNYLEDLSSKEYAAIYSATQISDNIYEYRQK